MAKMQMTMHGLSGVDPTGRAVAVRAANVQLRSEYSQIMDGNGPVSCLCSQPCMSTNDPVTVE
jgi:hypothetical protein